MARERVTRSLNEAEVKASGFGLTKLHGQHLLVNPLIIKSIIEKTDIKPSDVILEIGPGTGNLTMALLEKAKKVIAVEIDPRMVVELQKRVAASEYRHKLEIIHGDFTKMAKPPACDLVVSNTPYNVSSAIVFKLLSMRPLWRKAVLMFQKEFALRLCAGAGGKDYSRVSANCQLLAKTDFLINVPKSCFRPPPKVESAVISLVPRMPIPDVNLEEWDGLLKIIFNRKNKTVMSTFRANGVVDELFKRYEAYQRLENKESVDFEEFKKTLEKIINDSGLNEERAGKLDTVALMNLLKSCLEFGIHFV